MNIGLPKERRPFEYRVGMTPQAIEELIKHGHICYVEHKAGLGAGFSDQDYEQAGAGSAYLADLSVALGRSLLSGGRYFGDPRRELVRIGRSRIHPGRHPCRRAVRLGADTDLSSHRS